jgi:two-component system NarL family sensor kinase
MRYGLLLCFLIISLAGFTTPFADSVMKQYAQLEYAKRIQVYLQTAAQIQNKDYPNCIALCDKVIELARQQQDVYAEADAIFLKGLTSYFAGEYDQTLHYYLTSIQKFDSISNPGAKAKVLNELGIFYRRQKQDSLSEATFKEAYSFAQKAGAKGTMGTAINNQGICKQDAGKHTEAIRFFEQAQQIYVDEKDSIGVSYTMDYAAVSYAALAKYDLAEKLQLQSMDIRLRWKDTNAAALSLYSLAEIAQQQSQSGKQEKYLLECIAISERIKYKDLTADCYRKLAEVYALKGRFSEAYNYHVKYADLNNEIFNEKRSRQINDLQTRYETEKKERKIEVLSKENEIKSSRTKLLIVVFMGVLLLLSVSGYAYTRMLKSRKQKEMDDAIIKEKELRSKSIIEAEEKERVRIAKDLHDGVAQTMTAAKMQLEHFIDSIQGDERVSDSLQNAFDLIREAATEVRAVSHSMVPNALLKSGLVAALRDFVHRVSSEKLKVNLIVHGLNDRLDENVETVVYRVLQELVNNVIKHAQATEITIQLIHEATELSIMVEDNGVGFDIHTLSDKAGIGLKNITSRIEYLNGHVHFDSSLGNGTTAMIEIPLDSK